MGYRTAHGDTLAASLKLGTDFGARWNGGQKVQGKSMREFVPMTRLLATPDNWKRIQEYAAIPSRCDE